MTAATATTPAPPRPRSSRAGAASTGWPRVTAAVHPHGSSVHVVVARQDTADAPLSVVECVTLPASDAAALASFLARHKVGACVHLIPSTTTIARCTPLPASLSADRDQVAAALALLAETEMPSMIPAHRRAAGIIHPGPDSAPDAVLIVGWPERSSVSVPNLSVKEQTWTPELVALAALSRSLGGAELALFADRQAGSIALIATSRSHHAGANGALNGAAPSSAKTVARVLRGDASSDAAWSASIQRAVAESAASLAVPPSPIDAADASSSLIVLGSPMRRPRGASPDANWLTTYGLPFGALCALADSDPAARPLALLSAVAPREDASPLVRFVEYLATPRRAAVAVVCCLAVLLFLPLGVAKTREMLLAGRAGGAVELDKRLRDAERRVAFYRQLREKRWPMTKLLADISGAAPVGVHVDTISLSREQGVNIRGRAKDTSLVTQFRSNLAACGVFGAVATPSLETEGDAFSFQLEAQVVAPQYTPPRGEKYPISDFVKEPLAVRLYGERARQGGSSAPAGATAGAAPATADRPAAPASSDASRPTRATRGSLRGESPSSDSESSGGTRRAAASSSAIPEPISDEEIAKMDATTAMKEFTSRKAAASKPNVDPEVKQRLLEESEKCRARMVEARKSG